MRGGLVVGERALERTPAAVPRSALIEMLPLVGVSAMIMAMIWRGQEIVHIPGALQPVWGSVGLAILTAVIGRAGWERAAVLRNPVARALMVFALIAILGVATSLAPRGSASYFVKHLVPALVMAWTAATAIRGARDAEWLLLVCVAGAALFSLHALQVGYAGPDGRWTGFPYYDPNDLALHLVATIPLAAYFFRRGTSIVARLIAAGALGLCLLAIVKSESRGGLIGLLVVGAYVLVMFRAIPGRARVAGLVLGVVAIGALATGRYWSRIQTMLQPESDYNMDRNDPTGRIQLWKRGLHYATERPVLGVGLNAYITAESQLSPAARQRRIEGGSVNFMLIAHNTFVHIAAELGFIAVGVFVYMLWRARRGMVRVVQARRAAGAEAADRSAALARALIASLIGFITCGLFLSAPYFPFLYLLLGLVVGLERVETATAPDASGVVYVPADPDAPPRGSRDLATLPGRGGLVRGVTPPEPQPRVPTGRGGAW